MAVAENGRHALEAVEGRVPDLIVSDIMMPVMDGFALLAALRSDPATQTVPFIFLTAKSDDLSRQKGLRKGIDDYLTKPFDVDRLITRIDQIVQRSQLYQSKLNAKIGRDFSDRLLPKKMPVEPGLPDRVLLPPPRRTAAATCSTGRGPTTGATCSPSATSWARGSRPSSTPSAS